MTLSNLAPVDGALVSPPDNREPAGNPEPLKTESAVRTEWWAWLAWDLLSADASGYALLRRVSRTVSWIAGTWLTHLGAPLPLMAGVLAHAAEEFHVLPRRISVETQRWVEVVFSVAVATLSVSELAVHQGRPFLVVASAIAAAAATAVVTGSRMIGLTTDPRSDCQ